MQTTDSSNLFQSDAQHAKAAYRAAKFQLHAETGDPIKLNGRPLRVVTKQIPGKEADAWCAESGFVIRRVGLESGKTKQIYRGHCGPVTSLGFYTVPANPSLLTAGSEPGREVLLTGSWDKTIRVWDIATKTLLSTSIAHTDFVKSVLVIPSLKIVVTGSSDKEIRIWDLRPLEGRSLNSLTSEIQSSNNSDEDEPLAQLTSSTVENQPASVSAGVAPPAAVDLSPLPVLLSLKSHIRPIERLAFYDIQSKHEEGGVEPSSNKRVALVSVDSLGALKVWEIWRNSTEETLHGEIRSEIRPHESGIYDLVVEEEEMWTASSDNSVLYSTFDSTDPRMPPIPILRIPHPYHVKSVLSLPLAMPSLNASYIVTGSSDESIRIFDLGQLEDARTISTTPWRGIAAATDHTLPGLVREVEGHSHDVIDLAMYMKEVDGRKEAWLMSASVDGTVRRWRWPDILVKEKVKETGKLEEKESAPAAHNQLTEEEERELAELMRED